MSLGTADIRPEKADLRPERAEWGGDPQPDGWTNRWMNISSPVFYRTLSYIHQIV